MSDVTPIITRKAAEWWSEAILIPQTDPCRRRHFTEQLTDMLDQKTAPLNGAVFVLGVGARFDPTLTQAITASGLTTDEVIKPDPHDPMTMFLDTKEHIIEVQTGYRAPVKRLDLT